MNKYNGIQKYIVNTWNCSYYVKSIDDIHSYPLHVNPCIYISECVCIHE